MITTLVNGNITWTVFGENDTALMASESGHGAVGRRFGEDDSIASIYGYFANVFLVDLREAHALWAR